MDNIIKRRNLRFAEVVTEYFKFLVTEYGYDLIECADTAVRYRSDLMHVIICHERLSYEIEFRIGCRNSNTEEMYGLPEILKAMVPGYKGQAFYQASSRSAVLQCVSSIAAIISANCAELIAGSADAVHRVKMMREETARETTSQYAIPPIKKQAQNAWERKDYDEVIRLYKSIESELTPVELKRLEFAHKKIP